MTDLCTDCKDFEKVAQHIEFNSACFLPKPGSASGTVQNLLEKHCMMVCVCVGWGGWKGG